MKATFISVLINSYNYGRFVEEAIDSVLNQDFPIEQVEILVIDDGSTDGTQERVTRKYGSRIRYFYKENGGQASAFNLGFQHSRGEIVALLDADDYFLPTKLKRLAKEFDEHPEAGMVYHARLELVSCASEKRKVEFEGASGFLPTEKEKALRYTISPTSCLAFRRKLVEHILPIPETLRLQADTYPGILMPLVAPVIAIDEPLCVYRVHESNQFYGDEKQITPERMQERLKMFWTAMKETEKWGKAHKERLRAGGARLLLARFRLTYEFLQFRINPPSRLRLCLFLLRQNYTYKSLQTWKYTLFNYVNAVFALVVGYRKIWAWRERALEEGRRFFGKPFGAAERPNPGRTAKV